MHEEAAPARRRIVIDSFPESVVRYSGSHAVVCVDVLTASTTLVTSLAQGRTAFAARSREDALRIAAGRPRALLAGGTDGSPGVVPSGFHLLDSPSAIEDERDTERPLVLHSSPGCELIAGAAAEASEAFVCSLRNLGATARALAARSRNVAIIGAGYHSEFSCEDQFACAHLARRLIDLGFALADLRSSEIVRRWSDADPAFLAWGNSAAALRRAGRARDVDFALAHYDDLAFAARARAGGEIAIESPSTPAPARTQSSAAHRETSPSLTRVTDENRLTSLTGTKGAG